MSVNRPTDRGPQRGRLQRSGRGLSSRRRLAFEPLEHRSMLTAAVDACVVDVAAGFDSQLLADELPVSEEIAPAGDETAVESDASLEVALWQEWETVMPPPDGWTVDVGEPWDPSACWCVLPPPVCELPPAYDGSDLLPIDEQPIDEQMVDGGRPEDWVTEDWVPLTGGPDPIPDQPDDGSLPEGWSLTLVNLWETSECWITPPGDHGAPSTIEASTDETVLEGIIDWPDWGAFLTGGPAPIPESIEGDGSISDGSTDWAWDPSVDEGVNSDSGRPDGWIRCGTDLVNKGAGKYFVGQYREFVEQNPTWPEEHGAGGIQLMVITRSKLVPFAELNTPGEARAFDAWYEQILRGNAPVDEAASIEDGSVTVNDENLFSPDLNFDQPAPVAAPTGGGDGTPKSAGTSAAPVADAAWAAFFTSQSGGESAGTTPVGGRRRGR